MLLWPLCQHFFSRCHVSSNRFFTPRWQRFPNACTNNSSAHCTTTESIVPFVTRIKTVPLYCAVSSPFLQWQEGYKNHRGTETPTVNVRSRPDTSRVKSTRLNSSTQSLCFSFCCALLMRLSYITSIIRGTERRCVTYDIPLILRLRLFLSSYVPFSCNLVFEGSKAFHLM